MTERQARISAAMTALFQGESGNVALGYYAIRSRMDTALQAADAVAAPAVGVTVDEVRQAFKDILLPFVDAIAWDVDPESVNSEGGHIPHFVVNAGDIESFAMGFGTDDWPRVLAQHPYLDPEEWPNLDALLTAQPEPGTHDDAGQPVEGGVTG